MNALKKVNALEKSEIDIEACIGLNLLANNISLETTDGLEIAKLGMEISVDEKGDYVSVLLTFDTGMGKIEIYTSLADLEKTYIEAVKLRNKYKGITPIIAFIIVQVDGEFTIAAFKDQKTLEEVERHLLDKRKPYVRAQKVNNDSFGVRNITGEQLLKDLKELYP